MRIPKYCRNGDGRAFVAHPTIPTKSHRLYLGIWGTRESRLRYERWISEFMASQEPEPQFAVAKSPPKTVAELALEYLTFARGYYVKDGLPTKEYVGMKDAVGHFLDLYACSIGETIGPLHIKRLQKHLERLRYRRGVINNRVRRVKRFIKWCCGEELINPVIYHGLTVVGGLRKGRSTAPESKDVKPAPLRDVVALLPFMPPVIRAMIQIQYLAGMRPGEVCIMRPMDVITSGSIWLYIPSSHKTENSGCQLVKAIIPEAQEILRTYLDRDPEKPCFSPRETKEWRFSRREFKSQPDRKTKIYPSELRARERRKAERAAARGLRKWRDAYDTDSYRRAIKYAHTLAKQHGVDVPWWHPHQLRHTIATQISHALGEQASQVWLGHASLETTKIYTERNVEELVNVAAKVSQLLSNLKSDPQQAEQSPEGRLAG